MWDLTISPRRKLVRRSDNGLAFFKNSFTSQQAIEPQGAPNTFTTVPTQVDKPLKQSYSFGLEPSNHAELLELPEVICEFQVA